MNVLVATPYYLPAAAFGGPPEVIHGLNRWLVQRGNSVRVVTTTALSRSTDLPADAPRYRRIDGVDVRYHQRIHGVLPATYFESRGLVASLRAGVPVADVVALHGTWTAINRMAASESRRGGKPYIIYTHGSFEPWAIGHKRLKKWLYFNAFERSIYERASAIVVCNEPERQWLAENEIHARVRRIPWGCELPDLPHARQPSVLLERFPQLR